MKRVKAERKGVNTAGGEDASVPERFDYARHKDYKIMTETEKKIDCLGFQQATISYHKELGWWIYMVSGDGYFELASGFNKSIEAALAEALRGELKPASPD